MAQGAERESARRDPGSSTRAQPAKLEPAAGRPESAALVGSAQLLVLQRLAGNRAVNRLRQERPPVSVGRLVATPESLGKTGTLGQVKAVAGLSTYTNIQEELRRYHQASPQDRVKHLQRMQRLIAQWMKANGSGKSGGNQARMERLSRLDTEIRSELGSAAPAPSSPAPAAAQVPAPVYGGLPPSTTPATSTTAAPVYGSLPPLSTAAATAPPVYGGLPLLAPPTAASGPPPVYGGLPPMAAPAPGSGPPGLYGSPPPLSTAALTSAPPVYGGLPPLSSAAATAPAAAPATAPPVYGGLPPMAPPAPGSGPPGLYGGLPPLSTAGAVTSAPTGAIAVPQGPAAAKYTNTKSRDASYSQEFVSGSKDLPGLLGRPLFAACETLAKGSDPKSVVIEMQMRYQWGPVEIQQYRKQLNDLRAVLKISQDNRSKKLAPKQVATILKSLQWTDEECAKYLKPGDGMVASWMKKAFGWSQEDCDKYIPKPGQVPGTADLERPRVAAIRTEDARKDYELHLGATVTQGMSPEPYDTGALFSKFKGHGWAIYVMDANGRVFAAQHKVGLFHHSSFLAGGDVAGAGEIKIVGGVVKGITNKSGHYQPSTQQTLQVLEELRSRGVNLSGVLYHHVDSNFTDLPEVDAKSFYETHKTGASTGQNS